MATREEVGQSVEDATRRLYRIYCYHWEQSGDTRGLRSALELKVDTLEQ